MRNTHYLVKYCVPLIEGSVSRPFHDITSPNLVGRHYMTQKVTSTNGCYQNHCNHGNRTSYKAEVVTIIISASAMLRPAKLKFSMKMRLHLNSQFRQWLLGKLWWTWQQDRLLISHLYRSAETPILVWRYFLAKTIVFSDGRHGNFCYDANKTGYWYLICLEA